MAGKEERPHKYAVTNADNFTVGVGGRDVKSVDKILSLTQDEHEELQDLMANGRTDISQNLTYLDAEAAEKVAKKFLESQKPQASRGSVDTSALKNVEGRNLPQVVDVRIPPGTPAGLAARISANAQHLQAEATRPNPTEPETPAVVTNEDLSRASSS